METETRKLLGEFDGSTLEWADLTISASCNRVPTLDGHLENVWVETEDDVDTATATAALEEAPTIDLPSAPDQLISVFEDPSRPQPRLDRSVGNGMGIAVGPLQSTEVGLQFDCLAHNTIRGAAGASMLNGELLLDRGHL